MDAEEKFRERIRYYGSCLTDIPAYKSALDDCLSGHENCTDEQKIFLHVYAPVISMYAEWILRDAAGRGIKRLYFLARDSRPFYIAAKKLEEKIKTGIELRYLKVSRYSIRRAEYYLPDTDLAGSIFSGGMDVTFRKVLKRADLSDEEIKYLAGLADYTGREDRKLKYRDLRLLAERLRFTPEFADYVRAHAGTFYDNAVGYLKQEGLFEEIPYAIADSGWLGTMQKSISHLISAETGINKNIKGYYFGLYEIPESADPDDYICFYFRPYRDIKKKVFFDVCLFETVCSEAKGMTLGYDKTPYGFIPTESGTGNPNKEVIKSHEHLLKDFLKAYVNNISSETDTSLIKKTIYKLFKKHMSDPSKTESREYGDLKFCDDVLENKTEPVAAGWGRYELKNNKTLTRILIKAGLLKQNASESGWPEGSIVNAGISVRLKLFYERLYRWLMYIRKATFSSGK